MTIEISTLESLKQSFQKLLPVVDELSDGLGVLLLISLALVGWIFVYLFYLQNVSLAMSLGFSSLTLLPVLVLVRYWFALESLKDIPKIAEEIIEDVTDDIAQSWHAVKSGKKGALNFFGQAKKLFEIRSILNSTDDILQQYFSIGPLINPFYLFFGVLSFIGLFFLFLTAVLLAAWSIL